MEKELDVIYSTLKELLLNYVPPLVAREASDGKPRLDLVSPRPVFFMGKNRPEMWIAGLMIHKGYVGFYHMCAYSDEEFKSTYHPELLKLLRGKSCFHIKKLDEELVGHIRAAMDAGLVLYHGKGWV